MKNIPREYLTLQMSLPDGVYQVPLKTNWFSKLKIRLCYWLFRSIKKNATHEIKTITGTAIKKSLEK